MLGSSLLLLGLLLDGCGQVLRVHEQVSQLEGLAVIDGSIQVGNGSYGNIVVALFSKRGPGRFRREDWAVPSDDGTFQFRVQSGSYFVIAFVDENDNRQLDADEAFAFVGETEPTPVSIGAGERVTAPALELGRMLRFSGDTILEYRSRASRENIGRVVSLDDEMFSRGYYQLGIYRPYDFMDRVGSGLFLLRRYSPARPVVLLIHGKGGGPRDWATLAPALRRTGAQVLIAYYPSGVELKVVEAWLAEGILELRKRWRFQTLHIVGHSMGGLVARSLTRTLVERQQGLRVLSLTTINSPLGGLRSARTGVARAPIVIPSWRDLAAGSDYLDELSRWPQPISIPYFLLFTYRTGSSGDGVVPLSSQIPLWLQEQATIMRGFESEHGLTLHDGRAVNFVVERIGSVSRKARESAKREANAREGAQKDRRIGQ